MSLPQDSADDRSFKIFNTLTRWSRNLWDFSRPHTLIGTVLSIASIAAMTIRELHGPGANLPFHRTLQLLAGPLLVTLIPSILFNVYIVGLNQIFDRELDTINKPYLPIPARNISLEDAWKICLFCLVTGLTIAFSSPFSSRYCIITFLASIALGTVYSAPPLRLKRSALLASICILSVRGLLVNLGFYLHLKTSLLQACAKSLTGPLLSPLSLYAASFFVIYGILIALMKDIPDIRGDKYYHIRTFAVRVGARRLFSSCVQAICALFIFGAVALSNIDRSSVRLRRRERKQPVLNQIVLFALRC